VHLRQYCCSADTVSPISSGINTTCNVEAINVTDFDNLREALCLKEYLSLCLLLLPH
jgi:hypothetical protein